MNEITQQKSFQEKMQERIRESIGDLITDEELSKLIKTAVEDVFFNPHQVKTLDRWGSTTYKEIPPMLPEIVKDLLHDRVSECMKTWLEEHHEEVSKQLDATLREGLLQVVVRWFNDQIKLPLEVLGSQVSSILNKGN